MGNESNDADNCPPSWINKDLLERAVRSAEKDPDINLTFCEVKRATTAGDNYGSDMYRATVKVAGQTEERSIIIKSTKSGDGKVAKLLTVANIFDREIKMFSNTIPEMTRLLRKVSAPEFEPFTAEYLYSNEGDAGITIMMEDLKVNGFRLAERKLGLDLKHCLLVMRTIAKFHAASVVMHHKDTGVFEHYMKSNVFVDEHVDSMKHFFSGNVLNCARAVETWPDCGARFADKLYKMADTAVYDWNHAVKRDDSEYNVLSHGDLWANNMMFRYSEETGEVEDVRFVDFQLSHWTSPATDLQYFLNSSATPHLLEHPEVLIEEYLKVLTETLVQLGYSQLQPTATQINDQFERKGLFAALAAITIRTVVLADRSKVPDMSKVLSNQESIHLSEAYIESLKLLLPLYEKRGWI